MGAQVHKPYFRRKLVLSRSVCCVLVLLSAIWAAAEPNHSSDEYRNVFKEILPPTKGYAFGWDSYISSAPSVLHWRFGLDLREFAPNSQDALEKAGAVKLSNYVGSAQRVSRGIARPLGPTLFPGERQAVQWMTADAALVAYRVDSLPTDKGELRDLFSFLQAMKIETLITGSIPEDIGIIGALAREHLVNVALSGAYEDLVRAMRKPPKGVGVYLSADQLAAERVALETAVAGLQNHIQIVDLPSHSNKQCALDCLLAALYRHGVKPSLLVLHETAPKEKGADFRKAMSSLNVALRPLIAAEALRRSRLPDGGRGEGTEDQRRYVQTMTAGNSIVRHPVTPEQKRAVDMALPKRAIVSPKETRKLLVLDFNMGYPGHRSITTHNYAIKQLGLQTGAYTAVFDNDLDNLKYPNIEEYDGIFLNNTVGQIFSDPEVREGLLRFVTEGGGLAGIHASLHASLDWREFHEMMGAYPGGHFAPTENVWLSIDDPTSPLNAAFKGRPFLHQDEYFRFPFPPYDRRKLHVLLSIDTFRTDMSQASAATLSKLSEYGVDLMGREDGDYAVSWIKTYGQGRIFYTTMGHKPTLFMTPEVALHLLGAIQFILGDLDTDASPDLSDTDELW